MSQFLPTAGFSWMTKKEIKKTNLALYKEDSKKGLILQVDLEYPKELRDLPNGYPLGAEQVKVTESILSEYFQKIKEKYNIYQSFKYIN